MKVSLNWAQSYAKVDLVPPEGVDDLVHKIGVQLGAVEEVVDISQKYKGIVVARVVSCRPHPNADKLHLCTIDDGGVTADAPRDKSGHVQVVCGAPNAREGLLVAWLPPGSTVPSTFDKDPFVLEARDIRGQVSNGMLASAHELGIGEDHSGIVELDEGKPGDSFAELFKLNDHIIDIENKMFTHRPDCFGQLGVARELAGIQHKTFQSPDWYLQPVLEVLKQDADTLPLEVKNELPDLVPRFSAIAMSNIEVKPSPFWLQTYLSRVGIRPINNVVDVTNYYMMLTGQPIHAYDYDKVKALTPGKGAELTIRHPKKGEQITILGGKTIKPHSDTMMVAVGNSLVCVGGAIGGSETEVGENTKNIIIEAANWDMYTIRRTAMEHGIFTEAVTRFSKGQSPLQNDRVVAKAVEDLRTFAKGKVASEFIDIKSDVVQEPTPVTVTTEFINARLGEKLSAKQMSELLSNVEFGVETQNDVLRVTPPFWRTDIEIPEDVVEEVGRLYGYDHLPIELPARSITPIQRDALLDFKTQVRNILADAGANEMVSYSFVHGNLFEKVGQNAESAFRLGNALSPDLQYYRMSLTPSLLASVHPNIKSGHDKFALFEVGKAHNKEEKDPNEPTIPAEQHRLALVYANKQKDKDAGATYYQARKYLDELLRHFDLKTQYTDFTQLSGPAGLQAWHAPFAAGRSAVVLVELPDQPNALVLGIVGEYRPSVQKALKLPETAGFEIDLSLLLLAKKRQAYTPLSRFPKVSQDICLEVPKEVSYQTLFTFVEEKLNESKPDDTICTLSPVDIYQKQKDIKRVTFGLSISSYVRTLKAEEVNRLLDEIAVAANTKFGAKRI